MFPRLKYGKAIFTLANTVGLVVAVALFMNAGSARATDRVEFTSKASAFTQGFSAFRGRQYDIAVPALKYAAKYGVMRAKFYLAKIYSDSSGGWTDHARAYGLLREIIARYSNVDPGNRRVAPFVSQALTSIARYERDGIKSLKLKPSTARALAFFNHAASFFNDADAQFELAKHYLEGDGVEARVPYALNWLAGLSKRGHAGAQAFLANLYWDGRHTLRDPVRALALVTVAVENAKEEDQFWIEDLHHNIFCEASVQTRHRVHRVVGKWRRRFGRTQSVNIGLSNENSDLVGLTAQARRTCSNGDVVGDLKPSRRGSVGGAVSAQSLDATTEANRRQYTLKRTQPNVSDKRVFNGFGLSNASGQISAGRSVSTRPRANQNSRAIVIAPSGQDRKPDRSLLNGFMMQGSTGYGYSAAPGR